MTLVWRKSGFCTNTTCVEVTELPDGDVAMRDSKNPFGPWLRFTQAEWAEFVAGVRAGEFDPPQTHESAPTRPA